ncbi:MAG: MFS transporter [Candidatus Zixiibacteriota bacterium]
MSSSAATGHRTILFVATVASFLTPFMGSAINVALPPIAAEFGADAILLSWVATGYLLAAGVFLLPFGRLADIHGRKRVFLWGIANYSASSLLSALAPSIGWLIAARIWQGIGGSMIFGTGVAIVTSVFPAQERGRALGIIVAAVYAGLSLGPFAGGFLTHQLGWRSIFFLNVILGLVPLALMLALVRGEWAEARGESFDLAGSGIYGFSLVTLMYGVSRLPGNSGVFLITAGILGVAAFVFWELRVAHPVLNIGLFRRSTVFAMSNLAALINYSATFGVTFMMSLYLQYIKGLTPQGAGVVLIAQPVMMTIISPIAGRLSDRIESRVVASIGMACSCAALAILATLVDGTPIGLLVGCLMLNGIGFGLFSSPNTNAVMSAVEKKYYGVASATVGTMRLTGQMLSMGVTTLVLALFIGRAAITDANHAEFIHSVRLTLTIFAVLCLAGIFVSLARGKTHD